MTARSNRLAVSFDEAKIDALFADLNQSQLPGAAVGIAIDGMPVYRKGFGLASMELPVNLSPSIRMRIGSTSKHFTALAYMLLCEQGKAGLDEPIGKHMPELSEAARAVTPRQLMGNTSGLRDAADFAMQFSGVEGRPIPAAWLVSFYRGSNDINFPPGTTFQYNNGGWILLTALIERIAGRSLEEVLRDTIFLPTGMNDTLLHRWDFTFAPNIASSHVQSVAGHYRRTEALGGVDGAGAGSIMSTVDDMLRWMRHMDDPKVGSPETWKIMKTPQVLPNGTSTGYGLGLYTIDYRGITTLQHAGGVFGSNSQMLKVPGAGLDVVVMINRSDVSAAGRVDRILDTCLSNLASPPAAYRGPFATGIFRSPKSGRVAQLMCSKLDYLSQDEVQIVSLDGHQLPFVPDEKGILRTMPPATFLKYAVTLVGSRENPSSILLNEFGNLDEFSAVEPGIEQDFSPITGKYVSDATDTLVTIVKTATELKLEAVGRFGSATHNVAWVGDRIWRTWPQDELMVPPWGLLSFSSDNRSFLFSNALTRYLHFRRVD